MVIIRLVLKAVGFAFLTAVSFSRQARKFVFDVKPGLRQIRVEFHSQWRGFVLVLTLIFVPEGPPLSRTQPILLPAAVPHFSLEVDRGGLADRRVPLAILKRSQSSLITIALLAPGSSLGCPGFLFTSTRHASGKAACWLGHGTSRRPLS
jgi:hypothetical protein